MPSIKFTKTSNSCCKIFILQSKLPTPISILSLLPDVFFNLISNKETLCRVRSAPVMGVSCITGSRKRRKTYFTENEGHLCCAMWPTLGGGENWSFLPVFGKKSQTLTKGGTPPVLFVLYFFLWQHLHFMANALPMVTILWGDAVID